METAVVHIKKGGARSLKAGGAWIYDNEIEAISGSFENGDLVSVEAVSYKHLCGMSWMISAQLFAPQSGKMSIFGFLHRI